MPAASSFRSFAIVPAAGRSRRMGQPKLVLPFGERTVIEAVIAAWQAGGVDRVVVVCRGDDHRLRELCASAGALVATPAEAPPEMKDSVVEALRAVSTRLQPAADDVWLLAPADMPRLSPAVIRLLLASHDPRQPRIAAPVHGGRRGHPVLFPWGYAAEVERLSAAEGVNALLARHAVVEIEAGAEALPADLDTPDDLRRLQGDGEA